MEISDCNACTRMHAGLIDYGHPYVNAAVETCKKLGEPKTDYNIISCLPDLVNASTSVFDLTGRQLDTHTSGLAFHDSSETHQPPAEHGSMPGGKQAHMSPTIRSSSTFTKSLLSPLVHEGKQRASMDQHFRSSGKLCYE